MNVPACECDRDPAPHQGQHKFALYCKLVVSLIIGIGQLAFSRHVSREVLSFRQGVDLYSSSVAATSKSVDRWRDFAAEIADLSQTFLPPHSVQHGELLVLGSGLAHADILLNDEAAILAADYVFHCLYDRVTQIWIDRLRPDALDLRILYAQSTDRHDTYICMAEAMLHHVRRGKRVVAVFYGHPGFFATPTHRAIQIAKREGHVAKMRPGISALDHLVADVGFDPMIPGLLSYEASDLLIHGRRLDSSLHTVLWQVGVVGEYQYAPRGFENRGFDLLVDKLESIYGSNWEAIHYIAPQYAGVDALIDRHSIGSLRTTAVRSRINAMSTFYLAPRDVARIQSTAAHRLGLSVPQDGESMEGVAYDLTAYGEREKLALRRFENFAADAHYRLSGPSPAADFMLAISRDMELLARFRSDPAAVLAESRFEKLSDRARQLLEIPHPLAINAAIEEPAAR